MFTDGSWELFLFVFSRSSFTESSVIFPVQSFSFQGAFLTTYCSKFFLHTSTLTLPPFHCYSAFTEYSIIYNFHPAFTKIPLYLFITLFSLSLYLSSLFLLFILQVLPAYKYHSSYTFIYFNVRGFSLSFTSTIFPKRYFLLFTYVSFLILLHLPKTLSLFFLIFPWTFLL